MTAWAVVILGGAAAVAVAYALVMDWWDERQDRRCRRPRNRHRHE